jgi:O-antigen chain-terminating methyltransferase
MTVPFYRAFEDRHRGSREVIHERLEVYMPFLEPIKELYGERPVLDLGCGRGEWLELLIRYDFTPVGVDLDEGMLEACQTRGLPALQGDALATLERLEDSSQTVISGFHIAEHIPFDDLKQLIAQALRVLKPGGLLILETPNAENITVGTQNFYLDPTHQRPIPHLLLSFLMDYSGFSRSKLLRLQESPTLAVGSQVDLMSVLGGVSPDYAIVAQKQASPDQMRHFDSAFNQEFGLSLDALAQRYDAQASLRSEKLESHAERLSQSLSEVNAYVEHAEQRGQQLETSLRELMGLTAGADARLTSLEAGSNELRQTVQDVALRAQMAEVRYQQSEQIEREKTLRASEAEARLSAAQAINELLQAQLVAEKNQVQQLQVQSDSVKHTLKEQLALTSRLERELVELEDEYQKVALEQLAPQQVQLANLTQQLEDARDREALLEDQLDTRREEVAEAEAHIRVVEVANAQAGELVEELRQSLAVLQGELADLQRQNELADERNDLLQQANFEALRSELGVLNSRLNESLVDASHWKQESESLQSRLNESLGNAHHWWEQAVSLEVRLNESLGNAHHWWQQAVNLNDRLNESLGNAHHWWLQATMHEAQLNKVLSSTSWFLTSPIRGLKRATLWLLRLPGRFLKALIRPLLAVSLRVILRRPGARARLKRLAGFFPRMSRHIQRFAINRRMLPEMAKPPEPLYPAIEPVPEATAFPAPNLEHYTAPESDEQQEDLSGMTPGARRIYLEMKQSTRHKGTC